MESGFGYQWYLCLLSLLECFVVHDHLRVNQLLTLVLLTELLASLKFLNIFPVERGYHLTMALHNWQPAQQFRSLNSLRQSRICIHRLTTALPQESFYNIGIILLLLFCVCFPFMKRSDNETFRLSLADVFCVYILLLQIQASQIRHIKKVSPNKFRSIRNCLIHQCMMDNEISSINFNFLSLNARG